MCACMHVGLGWCSGWGGGGRELWVCILRSRVCRVRVRTFAYTCTRTLNQSVHHIKMIVFQVVRTTHGPRCDCPVAAAARASDREPRCLHERYVGDVHAALGQEGPPLQDGDVVCVGSFPQDRRLFWVGGNFVRAGFFPVDVRCLSSMHRICSRTCSCAAAVRAKLFPGEGGSDGAIDREAEEAYDAELKVWRFALHVKCFPPIQGVGRERAGGSGLYAWVNILCLNFGLAHPRRIYFSSLPCIFPWQKPCLFVHFNIKSNMGLCGSIPKRAFGKLHVHTHPEDEANTADTQKQTTRRSTSWRSSYAVLVAVYASPTLPARTCCCC